MTKNIGIDAIEVIVDKVQQICGEILLFEAILTTIFTAFW